MPIQQRDQRGATAVEYALLIAGIAAVLVTFLVFLPAIFDSIGQCAAIVGDDTKPPPPGCG